MEIVRAEADAKRTAEMAADPDCWPQAAEEDHARDEGGGRYATGEEVEGGGGEEVGGGGGGKGGGGEGEEGGHGEGGGKGGEEARAAEAVASNGTNGTNGHTSSVSFVCCAAPFRSSAFYAAWCRQWPDTLYDGAPRAARQQYYLHWCGG